MQGGDYITNLCGDRQEGCSDWYSYELPTTLTLLDLFILLPLDMPSHHQNTEIWAGILHTVAGKCRCLSGVGWNWLGESKAEAEGCYLTWTEGEPPPGIAVYHRLWTSCGRRHAQARQTIISGHSVGTHGAAATHRGGTSGGNVFVATPYRACWRRADVLRSSCY